MVALVPVVPGLATGLETVLVTGPDELPGEGPDAGARTATAWELRTDGVTELVSEVLAAVTGGGAAAEAPWGTYLAVDPETRQVVGTCGFRSPPRRGRVEIAFYTFPPFEGRGWATAMARALIARAYEHPDVHAVLAHTLPERGSATSVLTTNGLRCTGTVRRDRGGPDGQPAVGRRGWRLGGRGLTGRVWRWELHLRTAR